MGTKLYVSISSCVFVSAGCSGLEICGSGAGQDFPVGLPHSVNPGNCFNLYSCSADIPQHTFVNSTSEKEKNLLLPGSELFKNVLQCIPIV